MGKVEERGRVENDQCVVTARTRDMCGNSYGESQPHINSKEQINNNMLFGDFSFPEFLYQNVRDKLVHQSGFTSLRTLAGCWALSSGSPYVPICERFCSNRAAQTLEDRSSLTLPAFVPAPSLLCSSQLHQRTDGNHPQAAPWSSIRAKKTLPLHNRPWGGRERGMEKELLVSPVSERRKEGAQLGN